MIDIDSLSYREAQKLCKERGLAAKGKLSELQERLKLAEVEGAPASPSFADQAASPPRGRERQPLEPVSPASPLTPVRAVGRSPTAPSSGQRTQAIARSALAQANATPLPPLPGAEVQAQARSPLSPAKRPRSRSALQDSQGPHKKTRTASTNVSHSLIFVLLFVLTSLLISTLAAYTMRVSWGPVISLARTDAKGAFKDVSSQVSKLYTSDMQHLHDAGGHLRERSTETYARFSRKASLALKRHVVHVRQLAIEVPGKLGQLTARAFNTTAGWMDTAQRRVGAKPCQGQLQPLMLQETFATAFADCCGDTAELVRASAAKVGDRKKASANLVLVPAKRSDIAADIAMAAGCSNGLQGRCLLYEINACSGSACADEGPALQQALVTQLQDQPASLIILSRLENLSSSGLSVLLQLLGEGGLLNAPGCDVSTVSATTLLLTPSPASVAQGQPVSMIEVLDNALSERFGSVDLAALSRRISDYVLFHRDVVRVEASTITEPPQSLKTTMPEVPDMDMGTQTEP